MELLNKRQCIGIVLRGKYGGELRVQGRVVGLLLKRGTDELFSFRELLALDEHMSETGVRSHGFWIFGQDAAIGGFSCIVLT